MRSIDRAIRNQGRPAQAADAPLRRRSSRGTPVQVARATVSEISPRILYSADALAAVSIEPLPGAGPEIVEQVVEVTPAALLQSEQSRHELVVIDGADQDAARFLADFRAQADGQRELIFLMLDDGDDGLAEIERWLASAQHPIDAIHLVGHGDGEGFRLGTARIDSEHLPAQAGTIARWAGSLSAEADILIYGCDLAGSETGRALIDDLARLTGADVAASDDPTGAASLGGDWVLEVATGPIDTATLSSQWQGTLALTPANGETLVNNTGGGNHETDPPSSGQVATNGVNTVVVWENTDDIRYRIYGANDSGGQQMIPAVGGAKRSQPVVSMAADGTFVVAG
ncbi:MAG: DUF4347 domain-containing protein [Burkholderiaceae bacterium]